MTRNKSSISKAQSYREIGEFWDAHDVTSYWDATKPVQFEVDITLHTGENLSKGAAVLEIQEPTEATISIEQRERIKP
jgi:hypothetical protein